MVEQKIADRATRPDGVPRERIRIPKQSGRAFTVSMGELIRVIDVAGEQVADLVCFSYPNRSLRSSTDQTRDVARTLYISTGHSALRALRRAAADHRGGRRWAS